MVIWICYNIHLDHETEYLGPDVFNIWPSELENYPGHLHRAHTFFCQEDHDI